MVPAERRVVFCIVLTLSYLLLIGLVGCTQIPSGPQRDLSADLARGVVFGSDGKTCTEPNLCSRLPVELHNDYTLFFAEFDDEGWLASSNTDAIALGYDRRIRVEDTNQKDAIGNIKSTLRNLTSHSLIVLFIHGWKHNAGSDDGNVNEFRTELGKLSSMHPERNVVGIYVGWRGTPIKSSDALMNLTYYNRKAAAENVARGSVQELIAFLSAYERSRNDFNVPPTRPTEGDISPLNIKSAPQASGKSSQPVITIFIGHSFGGLILFESLSQPLLTYIIDDELLVRDRVNGNATASWALPDLAVLLNPAVEAVRFEPLYRAMRGRRELKYYGPRLVSITTTADKATLDAFPASRMLSAPTGSDAKYAAYINTIGHAQPYITHRLVFPATPPCTNSIDGGSRQCIGGSVLEPSVGAEFHCVNFREMWNITTDDRIMAGHNDITNGHVFDFVNELAARKFSPDARPEASCSPPKSVAASNGGVQLGPATVETKSTWTDGTRGAYGSYPLEK